MPQNPKGKNMIPMEADYKVEKWNHDEAFRLTVSIFKDEGDEDYTAIALNLPGATGCGETHEEAVESLKESVLGLIRTYRGHGDMIPWESVYNDELVDLKGSVKVIPPSDVYCQRSAAPRG